MDENDPWPSEKYELAPNDYLAAFGQVTLVYNMLENMMGHIFEICAPLEDAFAKSLFHKLNNRDRVDLLSAFVRENEEEPETRDAILHCILCYEICTENRNMLMHSTYFDMRNVAKLVKRASKDPTRELHFDVPLVQLRRLADETADVFAYAVGLGAKLFRRTWRDSNLPEVILPDKPPKPHKLTPDRPHK